MARRPTIRMHVSSKFAKMIKVEAAKSDKSIIDLTEQIAREKELLVNKKKRIGSDDLDFRI